MVFKWLELLPNSEKDLGSRGHSCAQFACFPHACMGSLWVVWLPPTIPRRAQVGFIGYTKLSVGVNVSMNSSLSLCVSPLMNW